MQLIFIRHGKPEIVGGDNDPALSAVARSQAGRLAAFIARERIGRVVSSPLLRARETAEPTSRILGIEAEIVDLRRDPVAWPKFMADPIGFCGGDPVAFTRAVLDAVQDLFMRGLDQKLAVFTHGLPINIVLSHALGLERITYFVPHYCSITRVNGSSLQDMTITSVNETAHLDTGA
jgi:broad specificity phosphatase PhoE